MTKALRTNIHDHSSFGKVYEPPQVTKPCFAERTPTKDDIDLLRKITRGSMSSEDFDQDKYLNELIPKPCDVLELPEKRTMNLPDDPLQFTASPLTHRILGHHLLWKRQFRISRTWISATLEMTKNAAFHKSSAARCFFLRRVPHCLWRF
jgi:hypothetical protein